MQESEKQLIDRLDTKLPWHDGGKEGEMPKALEYVLCDCGEYGLHADIAIGMWFVWSTVKRWVYRKEIVEVMKKESIDPRAYGYKGHV